MTGFHLTNSLFQVFCDRCIPLSVFLVLNWLGYANSFFNPIIYCHSIEFRRAFKRLLMCGLCREGKQICEKLKMLFEVAFVMQKMWQVEANALGAHQYTLV